jgi:hypothetical protein
MTKMRTMIVRAKMNLEKVEQRCFVDKSSMRAYTGVCQ